MSWRVLHGDARDQLATLPERSVQTCVTSPPYFGLRDYGDDGQIGLEGTVDEYVTALVDVFRAVRRVLRDDGTVWLNLGDSYQSNPGSGYANGNLGGLAGANSEKYQDTLRRGAATGSVPRGSGKPKDLLGVPWRVAFALQADGWYLRSEIIWAKPNPMPESVTDRPTRAHEQVFLLAKQPRYFWDSDAIREPHDAPLHAPGNLKLDASRNDHDRMAAVWGNPVGRNKRSVWTIATTPFPGAHFATMSPKLVEPCVLAGSPERACGVCGAPWTRVVERESRPNWNDGRQQKHDGTYYRLNPGGGVGNDARAREFKGFEPSCEHNDPTGQSVVLDPFAGSGTTGVVALRHNRSFVGVELNAEYVELARRRICDDQPLFNTFSEAA